MSAAPTNTMADLAAVVEPTPTQTSVAAEKTTSPSAAQIADILRQARLQIEAVDARAHAPIALVGIGCRFPGAAHTPAAFWQNLLAGHDAITPVPAARWAVDAPAASVARPNELAGHWGGFLTAVDQFDAGFFAISGREAPYIDPQQRLLLETAWEALEAAGIDPTSLVGSQTGVFIGISSNDYSRLQQTLGVPVNAYAGVGNALSIAANRISYLLGLHGPSLAIDTACSSSLVAVHHACQSLRRGECDGALVGGVNLILSPEITSAFAQAGMLAADGRCKTFDARADGYVRSEGVGIVYLKRLADAQCAGDPIIAVICGSAVNQDGRSNGLTAPNGLAQQRVIRAALHDAGIASAQIGYVETHGTGTALGDPIEVNALKAVLREGRGADQPCWLGTVKANIGHMEAAAGIAGLIKTALCLQHGQIPPQLHLQTLNPHISLDGTPLAIPTQTQPWPAGDTTRYAGVSSFGFGGTNAHLILREAPPVTPTVSSTGQPIGRTHHVFTLAAQTAQALPVMAQAYAAMLAANPTVALDEICFTVNTGRTHFAHRLAVVTPDVAQLQSALAGFAAGQPAPAMVTGTREGAQPPAVAFLFTGQGAQYPNMGRQLYASAPVFRQTIDQCDQLLRPLLGCSLIDLLYPANQAEVADQGMRLDQTAYTQPALFAVEYALAQLWLSWGIKPDFVMGHSVGEIVAACVAGAFTLEQGLRLVARRGQLMQSLPADGAMVTLFADAATVSGALAPFETQVAIAAINGADHTVISGERTAVATILAGFAARGIEHQMLNVSHAFHSPLMEPILADLAAEAAAIDFQPLQIALVSNLTGTLLPVGHRFSATYWRDHARQLVRFTQGLDQLLAQGCRLFVEIGPKPILCRLSKRHFDAGAHWLPSLYQHQDEWATLLNSLATLYTQGLPIQWRALYPAQQPQRLALPTYPFQRKRYWLPEGNRKMYTNGIDPTPVATLHHAPTPTKFDHASAQPASAILTDLRTLVASLLQVTGDEVAIHTSFLALGADSIVLMDAARRIEQRYGLKLDIRRFFEDLATPAALASYIAAQLPADWTPVQRTTQTAPAPHDAHHAVRSTPSNAESSATTAPTSQQTDATALPVATTQQLLDIVAKQLELLTRYDLSSVALAPLPVPITNPIPNSRPNGIVAEQQGHPLVNGLAVQPTLTQPKLTVPKTVPLTEAQQQLWFLSQLSDEASIAYNESVSLQLQGDLDLPALHHAVQILVNRHEALRTVIAAHGETQLILPTLPTELPLIDFSEHDADARATAVATWLDLESRRPVDLATGPLFRVNLLKLAPAEYLLVMTAHHIIIDGLSMAVLLQELSELYNAAYANRPATLTPAPQFSAYVEWQATHLQSAHLAAQENYWLQQLAGTLPVLELPLDRPRPPVQSYQGAVTTLQLDRKLTTRIKQLSQQQGCTLFMTLFASYMLLLQRLSGQEKLIVGIPAAGRHLPDGERVVGYCTHLLPIRHTLVGNPSFGELLQTLRSTLLDAYANQDYPFARLINKLNVSRDLSLAPIVGSTFNLTHQPTLPTFTGLTATLGPRPTSFVDHELGLNIIESAGTLTVDFEFNTDLFAAATMARIAGHFETLLHAIVATPALPVLWLPLLTEAERHQLLVEWNATVYPFDDQAGYHELFEQQVIKTPDAVAVLYEQQQLTYAELNAMANGIAHQLRAAGVGVDSVVALLCERSPIFLAAALAIFKAGGAYLPLDVRAPANRQSQVLGQSRTKLLLVTADFVEASAEALAALPADGRPQVLQLETLTATSTAYDNPPALDPTENGGARLAYVIYTSGSTGLPKGAMVEQRGMINHLYAKIKDLGLTASDTVAQTAPQSFDISVWQFFSTLILGGRVHIFPDQIAADPLALLQQTASQQITILEVVPSLLRMMVDELAQGLKVDLRRLRWMIPTGEALPPNLARQWLRLCPQIPLVNAYGPTECSDDVTHYVVTEPPAATVVNMPIGRPIINLRMYILDAHLQPVPIGVAGELYVGGIGVGRGYIHDAVRTRQAFVPDPFSRDDQARLYKTGDKARYLPDGNIEYLGRLDYQVKIRGFRIELGEIEAVLEQHAAVYQAIVMDQPDPTGSKRLVAYVALGELAHAPDAEPVTILELRRFLGNKLPDYMVPAAFVLLAAIPLTPNGKVDRKALPAPDFALSTGTDALVPPRTATETQLAEIWATVLKIPVAKIGIHQDFFSLGGHSLLATQAASRIRQTFQIELPLQTYFTEPTIADLAEYIETTQWAIVNEPTVLATALAGNEEEGEL